MRPSHLSESYLTMMFLPVFLLSTASLLFGCSAAPLDNMWQIPCDGHLVAFEVICGPGDHEGGHSGDGDSPPLTDLKLKQTTGPLHETASGETVKDCEDTSPLSSVNQTETTASQIGPTAKQAGQTVNQTGPTAKQTGPTAKQTGQTVNQTGQTVNQTGQTDNQSGQMVNQTGQTAEQPSHFEEEPHETCTFAAPICSIGLKHSLCSGDCDGEFSVVKHDLIVHAPCKGLFTVVICKT